MRSVIVVGGSGFIGSVLLRRLRDLGVVCINLDRRQSPFYPEITKLTDVRDSAALHGAMIKADAIYLLAAEHADDVRPISLYYDVNVQGARNVCDAADRLEIRRIIFTSSVAVYGLDADNPNEEAPLCPFNDYGKSKLEAEEVLRDWAAADPRRMLTVVRPAVVFGERNRGNVYNLIEAINSRRFVMVGDGRNTKSMSYVENVAAFLEWVMNNSSGIATFNYADEPDLTMSELVATIRTSLGRPLSGRRMPYAVGLLAGRLFDIAARLTGRQFPISEIRVRKFCANTQVNAKKSRIEGFSPVVDLSEGIARTIRHEFLGHRSDQIWFEGSEG